MSSHSINVSLTCVLWINMDVFTLYQCEPYTCHLDINMDVFTLYQCEPYMFHVDKHGCLHTSM